MVSKNIFFVRDVRGVKGLFINFLKILVVMLLLMNGCSDSGGGDPDSPTAPGSGNLTVICGGVFEIDPDGFYFVKSYDTGHLIYLGMDVLDTTWVHTFKAISETASNPAIITLSGRTEDGFIEKTYQITVFSGLEIFRVFPNLWTQLPVDEDSILSEIKLFPFKRPLSKYMECDGAILPISGNERLFSIIGNKFGGDGSTTFALPDLSQEFPLEGLNYQICTEGVEPAEQPNPPSGELQYYSILTTHIPWNLFMSEIVLIRKLTAEADKVELCDGRLLNIRENTALFALVGTTFGGDGKTTFALPNLSSVTPPVDEAKYYIVVEGIFPPRE